MLKTHQLILLSAMTILCACGNPDESSSTKTDEKTEVEAVIPASTKEITTSSGKIIILEESHPAGASLSNFSVHFKGDTSTRLSLTDQDPMSTHLMADLDGNGFDELYLITTSVGSGSYGKVCGFTSNNDKSFSFIYFPELTEKDIQSGQLFEGYEGKDSFYIEKKKIIRQFPVSGDNKKNKKISYDLKRAENGFSLLPSQ